MRIANPRAAGLGALGVSLLAMLAFLVPTASAEYLGHVRSGTIEGSGTHSIGYVIGMAVDNSSGPSHGDIYLTEGGSHRVQKFDANGNFILMFGDEVNATTGGDVCPVNPGDVCKEGTNGGGAQQLGSPALIAVDNSNSPSRGSVYVSEFTSRSVRKYNENGVLQTGWGNNGVQTGAGSSNEGPFQNVGGVAVDNAGNLSVLNDLNGSGGKVIRYTQSGTPIPEAILSCAEDTNQGGLALAPNGTTYYKINNFRTITQFTGAPGQCHTFSLYQGEGNTKEGLAVDPVTGTVFGIGPFGGEFGNPKSRATEYILDPGTGRPVGPTGTVCPESAMGPEPPYSFGCPFTHAFGAEELAGSRSIAVNGSTNTVYVNNFTFSSGVATGTIAVFSPLNIAKATTGSTTAVAQTTATVTGHVDPDGAGNITECYFEFGPTVTYGNKAPCTTATPISSPADVEAELTKLSSGHIYHYRMVAVNALGRGVGADKTLTTTAPPSIDSFSSSDLTATTADLHATIVPNSIDTTYRFEYGTSIAYGTSVPIPDEDIGAGATAVDVTQHLENLGHFTYHFRVVAHNVLGTTTTEDQTFNFFPPECPNRTVRQATGSDYLPDCRAYELVSPANAGNIVWAPNQAVPVSTYATDPARMSFMGSFGVVTGAEPPNGLDDMYTATRSPTGWHTSFIGKKGNEVQDNCFENSDLQLSVFLVFRCEYFIFQGVEQPPTNLPFIFDSTGNPLGRWPVSWSLIPDSDSSKGAIQPSPDMSHMAFSSNNVVFAPNGLNHAPGSAYDYDTATGSTKIISYDSNGEPIAQEPGNKVSTGEFILFPGVVPREFYIGKPESNNTHPSVSKDGSHILMSTASGPYEQFTPEPIKPVRLYMRVDDIITYEVSGGRPVKYVGMTEDGKKVFFTTNEQLTSDDHDTSRDLYMWDEESESIIRISAGEAGTGDTDSCTPSSNWTSKCSVQVPESEKENIDNFISPKNGDIYFYSPERLVGVDAAAGEKNLYVWHNGELKYVAAANVSRIQTTPTDTHMAFITSTRVGSFDNKGFSEMYTYDPGDGIIRCVSCPTEGKALTGNVEGSLNGRYLTEDGKTFFYTPDGQVPYDTNGLYDVYEFVDGRPQLITTGTANLDSTTTNSGQSRKGGLVGVSADGVNAYFATYDTLVPEDQNGQFIKFYDARTGGGFPIEVPLQPCQAADECHGPGSEPPLVPTVASGDNLGAGGNTAPEGSSKQGKSPQKSKKKRAHKRKHHRHHAQRSQGASR